MEFRYRTTRENPSNYPPPPPPPLHYFSRLNSFNEQALRGDYMCPDLIQPRDYYFPNHRNPRESFFLELEKQQIRESIMAAEMHQLEEEVRREMILEREMSLWGEMPMNHRFTNAFIHDFEAKNIESKAASVIKEKKIIHLKRKAVSPPPTISTILSIDSNKKQKKMLRCDLCQVSATSEVALKEHFDGKKHKFRVERESSQIPGKNFAIGFISRKQMDNSSDPFVLKENQNENDLDKSVEGVNDDVSLPLQKREKCENGKKDDMALPLQKSEKYEDGKGDDVALPAQLSKSYKDSENDEMVYSQPNPQGYISRLKCKAVSPPPTSVIMPSVDFYKKSKKIFRCELCQVSMTREQDLKLHFDGKKHNSRVKRETCQILDKNFAIGLYSRKAMDTKNDCFFLEENQKKDYSDEAEDMAKDDVALQLQLSEKYKDNENDDVALPSQLSKNYQDVKNENMALHLQISKNYEDGNNDDVALQLQLSQNYENVKSDDVALPVQLSEPFEESKKDDVALPLQLSKTYEESNKNDVALKSDDVALQLQLSEKYEVSENDDMALQLSENYEVSKKDDVVLKSDDVALKLQLSEKYEVSENDDVTLQTQLSENYEVTKKDETVYSQPNPKGYMSRPKRKALSPPPTSAIIPLIDPYKKSKKLFRCELCQVGTSCEQDLKLHFEGKKHNSRVKRETSQISHSYDDGSNDDVALKSDDMALPLRLSENYEDGKNDETAYSKPNPEGDVSGLKKLFRCELCQVSVTSEIDLKKHFQGKKHKSRVERENPKISDKISTIGINSRKAKSFILENNPKEGDSEKVKDGENDDVAFPIQLSENYEDSKNDEVANDSSKFLFWCEICKFGASSKKAMNDHAKGKEHKSRIFK